MPKNYFKTLVILVAILFVAALLVAFYVYLSSKEAADSTANLSLRATEGAPFTDQTGTVVDLTQYANQIRVVNSWASWSPLSKDELPLLDGVAANYAPKGIVFLAINRKETREYASGYLTTLPALNNLKIVFDPADSYFQNVEGYAMPETIVFDKEGNVSAHYRGLITESELAKTLDELIATYE